MQVKTPRIALRAADRSKYYACILDGNKYSTKKIRSHVLRNTEARLGSFPDCLARLSHLRGGGSTNRFDRRMFLRLLWLCSTWASLVNGNTLTYTHVGHVQCLLFLFFVNQN